MAPHSPFGCCRTDRPEHEKLVSRIASRIGFTQISLSSALSPSIKAVSRGNSSALDAYLSPILRDYVDRFNSHFVQGRAGRRTDFMKSDGGLVADNRCGHMSLSCQSADIQLGFLVYEPCSPGQLAALSDAL